MTTLTLRPLQSYAEERGDLALDRHTWAGESRYGEAPGTPHRNRFGRYSHATCPGYASAGDGAGYLHSGVRETASPVTQYNQTYGAVQACVTLSGSEGQHERTLAFIFQVPLTTGQAAGITSARLVADPVLPFQGPNGYSNVPPSKDGRAVWAWKMYGVAEDNVHFGRQGQGGRTNAYEWTYMNEVYPRIPYKSDADRHVDHADRDRPVARRVERPTLLRGLVVVPPRAYAGGRGVGVAVRRQQHVHQRAGG